MRAMLTALREVRWWQVGFSGTAAVCVFVVMFVASWVRVSGDGNVCRRQGVTQFSLRMLETRIIAYRVETGALPQTLPELVTHEIGAVPKNLNVADVGRLTDGWAREFHYEIHPNGSFSLFSWGRDGAAGGVGLDADLFHDNRHGKAGPTFTQFCLTNDFQEVERNRFVVIGFLAAALAFFTSMKAMTDAKTAEQQSAGDNGIAATIVVALVAMAVGVILLPLGIPSGH